MKVDVEIDRIGVRIARHPLDLDHVPYIDVDARLAPIARADGFGDLRQGDRRLLAGAAELADAAGETPRGLGLVRRRRMDEQDRGPRGAGSFREERRRAVEAAGGRRAEAAAPGVDGVDVEAQGVAGEIDLVVAVDGENRGEDQVVVAVGRAAPRAPRRGRRCRCRRRVARSPPPPNPPAGPAVRSAGRRSRRGRFRGRIRTPRSPSSPAPWGSSRARSAERRCGGRPGPPAPRDRRPRRPPASQATRRCPERAGTRPCSGRRGWSIADRSGRRRIP